MKSIRKTLIRTNKCLNKVNFFVAGLVIFFSLQFFIHSKLMYFLSFGLLASFFYLHFKRISIALMFSLIISIFFEVGLASRMFTLEPAFLNLGSGWRITPQIALTFLLLIETVKNRKNLLQIKLKPPDIILTFFFLWVFISFLFQPNFNFFIGMTQLFESLLFYFLLRLNLKTEHFNILTVIFLSLILFQSAVSFAQLFNKRPLGIISETALIESPYSLTTVEGAKTFRITGTFGHPNMLAAFLISLAPFLILTRPFSLLYFSADLLLFILVFLTYSRISWVFFIIEYYFCLTLNKISFARLKFAGKKYIIPAFLILLLFLFLIYPGFIIRLRSTAESLDEFGSLGMRIKLTQEGFNLLMKNPFFGVGLDRSLEFYAKSPVTDLFKNNPPGPFYKIHNTFLEIASETGLGGLLFFTLFLYLILVSSFKKESNILIKQASMLGLSGLIIVSYLNPFLHSLQLSVIFLLSTIILV